MCRRAMTMFELLIAIALIAGIIALAFPLLDAELSHRSFESTNEQLTSQLLLARTEAMRTRTPLEVVYQPDGHRVIVRPFAAGTRALDVGEHTAAQRATGSDLRAIDQFHEADDAEGAVRLEQSWAVLPLPDDYRIVEFDDAMVDAQFESAFAFETFSADDLFVDDLFADMPIDPLRMTVYLGDGSALLSKVLILANTSGRRATLKVNPWTGLPSVLDGVQGDEGVDDPDIDDEEDASMRDDVDAAFGDDGGAL